MLSLLTFVAFIYSASAVGCGYGQVTLLDSEFNFTEYLPIGLCVKVFEDGVSSSYKVSCETDSDGDEYPLFSEYNDFDCTGEDLNRTISGDFVPNNFWCSGLFCATTYVYNKENSTDDECSNYANWESRYVNYVPTGGCIDYNDDEGHASMESTCSAGAITINYYDTKECNSTVADSEEYETSCNPDGVDNDYTNYDGPVYYEIVCNSAAAVKTLFAMVVGVAFVFLV